MVHKGTIPIREVKSEDAAMILEDCSYRLIGRKLATEYLQRKHDEEGEKTRWMWYAGYFALGCFFWETLPSMIELVRYFINL